MVDSCTYGNNVRCPWKARDVLSATATLSFAPLSYLVSEAPSIILKKVHVFKAYLDAKWDCNEAGHNENVTK
jgi:hypothetical protein